MIRSALTLVASAATLSIACSAPGPSVPFRVVALGPDPFFAGTVTDVAVTLERDGVRDESSTVRFAPDATTLTLPPMAYGDRLAIVVETELSGLVLARGRSFPFAVSASGAAPRPDVTLGALGRFASVGHADGPVTLVAPSAEGALLASGAGLARFVAHDAGGLPAIGARVAWPSARLDGTSAALGDGILVAGGHAPGATLFAADGSVVAELSELDVRAESGIASVVLDDTTLLLLGGRLHDGTLVDDVVRVTLGTSALEARALSPLPAPRADARALRLSAHIGTAIAPRVLVLDGTLEAGPASDVVLLDPAGALAPRSAWIDAPVRSAAWSTLDVGLVLLAGGRDAADVVTAMVSILVVQPDQEPPIAVLSPAPPPLFRAREHATAVSLGAGLALVVGGTDATGVGVPEGEIAEVQLDSLPGNLVLTGSLESPGARAAAARLSDRSVLVSVDGAVSIYFPPRGE